MAREEFISVTEKDNVRVFIIKARMRHSDAERLGRLKGRTWLRPKSNEEWILIVDEVKDAIFEDIEPQPNSNADTSTEK